MPAHRTFDRERTAAIILESLDLGISPAQTLMDMDSVTIAQARYMVRTVRAEGLLGIPPHSPVRVHVSVGTPRRAQSYLACEHCRTPWPCPPAFPYGSRSEPTRRPPKKRRKRKT